MWPSCPWSCLAGLQEFRGIVEWELVFYWPSAVTPVFLSGVPYNKANNFIIISNNLLNFIIKSKRPIETMKSKVIFPVSPPIRKYLKGVGITLKL